MEKAKLIEVIRDLDSYDGEGTIHASKPWTAESIAIVAKHVASGVPPEAEELNLKYFLEVILAREILDGWIAGLEKQPTLKEKCARLIRYAIDDA